MMMSFISIAIDLHFIESSEDPNYGYFWGISVENLGNQRIFFRVPCNV